MTIIKQGYTKGQYNQQPKTTDISAVVPPNDAQLEQKVLGIILVNTGFFDRALQLGLQENDFYNDKNKVIYKAMTVLHVDKVGIDNLTVMNKIKELFAGQVDALYIFELTNIVAAAGNFDTYILILRELSIKRHLLTVSQRMIISISDNTEDVFDLCENFVSNLSNVIVGRMAKTPTTFEELKQRTANKIEQNIKTRKEGKKSGYVFGISALDNSEASILPGHVTLVGARPGRGKSVVLLTSALTNAQQGKCVLFFSLEMIAEDLCIRIASNVSQINSKKIMGGLLNDQEYYQVIQSLNEVKADRLFLHDEFDNSLQVIVNTAKAHATTKKVDMLFIDYLQLIPVTGDDSRKVREQQIAQISRSLKMLAKELNAAVVAAVQLNRQQSNTGGSEREPTLADLRESGSLEQDASQVLLVTDTKNVDGEVVEIEGIGSYDTRPIKGTKSERIRLIRFIMAKDRNGSPFVTHAYWDAATSKFYELNEYLNSDLHQKLRIDSYTPTTEAGSMAVSGKVPVQMTTQPFRTASGVSGFIADAKTTGNAGSTDGVPF